MIFELNYYDEWMKYHEKLPVKIGFESMFAPMHSDYCNPNKDLSLYGKGEKLMSRSIDCDLQ